MKRAWRCRRRRLWAARVSCTRGTGSARWATARTASRRASWAWPGASRRARRGASRCRRSSRARRVTTSARVSPRRRRRRPPSASRWPTTVPRRWPRRAPSPDPFSVTRWAGTVASRPLSLRRTKPLSAVTPNWCHPIPLGCAWYQSLAASNLIPFSWLFFFMFPAFCRIPSGDKDGRQRFNAQLPIAARRADFRVGVGQREIRLRARRAAPGRRRRARVQRPLGESRVERLAFGRRGDAGRLEPTVRAPQPVARCSSRSVQRRGGPRPFRRARQLHPPGRSVRLSFVGRLCLMPTNALQLALDWDLLSVRTKRF